MILGMFLLGIWLVMTGLLQGVRILVPAVAKTEVKL
jgi:hypothetical protein